MNRQVAKLLIILNVCFWLAVSFVLWHYSAGFPQMVVSSIIVLGMLAIVGNLGYWINRAIGHKRSGHLMHRGYFAFILLSTLAQISLIIFFLL
ncbi:MAG TPA: hypothetical protein VLC98_17255 [Phnomibacter sp.]|nr:hypothetical protein [Phnomibacter sp.]